MRKVRTALDTAIRTKDVRSFSGRYGWSGRSSRGHPPGGTTRLSAFGMHRRWNASAVIYRKEAIERLTPSQKRAFEKMPAAKREELLIKAEKKIDRRISAGRYRDYGTTAAVAEGSAGMEMGRSGSRNFRARTFSEQMDEYGWNDYRTGTKQTEIHEKKTDAAWRQAVLRQKGNTRQEQGKKDSDPVEETSIRRYGENADDGGSSMFSDDDFYTAGYRRRRRSRQLVQKAKERRIKALRKAAGGSGTGNPLLELNDRPRQGGSGENCQSRDPSDTGNAGRRRDTSDGGKHAGSSDKAGKKISHDYARTLGRLVESQVRFTKQLENGRMTQQKQKTIQEMEEKEAKRVYRIVSFSFSKLRAAGGELVKAARFLASKGKGYLVLLLVPVMLLVMMVPLLLSSISLTQEETTANATAAELVEYALSWVGVTQYVWGAGRAYETDWQDYTDCSGFVHGVFSHFGFEIGGTTVYMEGSGTLVDTNSTAKALPGDIILFFTGDIAPGNSTHVGIYIGNGQMVHCTGSRSNTTPETAGPGVMVTMVSYTTRQYQVRRIIPEDASGGVGTGGHRVDPTNYSTSDLQLIWAIVAQEDNGSYEGALAVISSAMNRTESPTWSYLGNTAMKQLCAPGQYCYSNDHYWEARLGGNVPEYVKQAVNDCLKKGIRNHSFTSFRSTKGKTTGPNAVQIGGNWFFGN